MEYMDFIFKILNVNGLKPPKSIINTLMDESGELSDVIFNILWKFIVSNFKRLTLYITDGNVECTSNKIDNSLKYVFGKSIK